MQIPEELHIDDGTLIRGEDEIDDTTDTEENTSPEEEETLEEDDDFPFGL